MKVTEEYIDKIVELAKEVRELQLKDSEDLPDDIKASKGQILANSKINYLLGYILSLETNERK